MCFGLDVGDKGVKLGFVLCVRHPSRQLERCAGRFVGHTDLDVAHLLGNPGGILVGDFKSRQSNFRFIDAALVVLDHRLDVIFKPLKLGCHIAMQGCEFGVEVGGKGGVHLAEKVTEPVLICIAKFSGGYGGGRLWNW